MKRLIPALAALLAVAATARAAPLILDRAASRFDIQVKATAGSFTGRLDDYRFEADLDPATGRLNSAVLDFDFRAVKSGEDARDRHMHAWQQTDRFPAARFVLDRLEPAPGGGQTAIGRFTFHGLTRELSFPAAVKVEGGRVTLDGTAVIDTRAFGLPVIRMFLALRVDPLVRVGIHLQGTTGPAN